MSPEGRGGTIAGSRTIGASQGAALEEVLAAVHTAAGTGRPPAAVFDIDDTILSTAFRHLRILREFALSLDGAFPAEIRALGGAQEPAVRYRITDTARACGVADEDLLGRLRAYWSARFFRNEYLLEDLAVPGAPAFCRELRGLGARIVYLTGRDEAMKEGTIESLRRHAFPSPGEDGVHLLLKPRFDMPDAEHKNGALSRIAAFGEVAAAFENEPEHVNELAARFPRACVVLVGDRHSGKPVKPSERARRIQNYRIGNP